MAEIIDLDRRRFLGTTAVAIAAAQLGMLARTADASQSFELGALSRATAWLNSPPPTPTAVASKVVLVDFCTYTCINWLRTLPYIRAWAKKYRSQLAFIGVHTPEFAFEKNLDNVRRAMQQIEIDYPIAIDNDYTIWRAFDNRYWPALYLIDPRGRVRYQHFGEGEYVRSEQTIQVLLREAGAANVDSGLVSPRATGIEVAADWGNLRTPETYLGWERSPGLALLGLSLNRSKLTGTWTRHRQSVGLKRAGGRIAFRFHARDLHLVMGPARRESPVRFQVSIDGRPPETASGVDVDALGNGTVVEQRLYQLIRQPTPIVDRTFEIEFLDPGVEAFAFTFG